MFTGQLNDAERREWVLNDEGLYRWWQSTRPRQGLYKFVREHRQELTDLILAQLNKPPHR